MQKPKEAGFWSLFRRAMQGNNWVSGVWWGILLSGPPLFVFPLFFSSFYERYLAGSIYFNLHLLISLVLLRTMWLRDTEDKEKKDRAE